MAPNYGSDLNSKNADHVRCLLWIEQKEFWHGRKPPSIIKDGKYKAKYCTTWEPESEDESLRVCVCLCTPVSVRCLWREPLASFSKFRFDLRVTASLLCLESVLSGMNENRDNRQKAWRANTCCCRLGLFKPSELDGAHNSSWKRNDFNCASYKADHTQQCQQLLRL